MIVVVTYNHAWYFSHLNKKDTHYSGVLISAIGFSFTGVTIVHSTVCSGEEKWKHQRSASLAFVRGIHRGTLNFPHKGPITRKMFPFNYVIIPRIKLPSNSLPVAVWQWCDSKTSAWLDYGLYAVHPQPEHAMLWRQMDEEFLGILLWTSKSLWEIGRIVLSARSTLTSLIKKMNKR